MLVVSAVAFGCNAPFARLASLAGVAAAHLVTLRVAIVLCVLAGIVVLRRSSLRVPRGERAMLAGLGVASAAVGLGYLTAITFIPVGIAVLVFYTYPLVILAATPLVDRVRPTLRQSLGFVAAFAGIALAIGPTARTLDWRGLALAAAASVAAATQFFLGSRAPGGGGLTTVFWIHVVVFPAAVLASWTAGGLDGGATLGAAAWPVALSTLGYLVGFSLQIIGLGRASAAAAGLIFCLEPIVATLLAAALLDEPVSAHQIVGALLVLAGIVCSLELGPASRTFEPAAP